MTYLGTGVYSVPEASRLCKVSAGRIRRWLRGYEFESQSGRKRSPPVWMGSLEPIDGVLALSFLDLMEVRIVDAFLRTGVTWKVMRKAHAEASQLVQSPH